jgi:hypothetical protein
MSPVRMPLLSPGHAAVLLDRVILEEVLGCVDMQGLRELEEMLAVELLQVEEIDERELLPLVREMIGRALVRCVDGGGAAVEEDARTRYFGCLERAAATNAWDTPAKVP